MKERRERKRERKAVGERRGRKRERKVVGGKSEGGEVEKREGKVVEGREAGREGEGEEACRAGGRELPTSPYCPRPPPLPPDRSLICGGSTKSLI